MKRAFAICFFFSLLFSAKGQISINADSLVMTTWDLSQGKDVITRRIKENMSIEIDKDLLTLRILGKTDEMAYIEKAYLIDFLEVNDTKDKWLFQGSDKNCVPCTITLDIIKKKISFITVGKENGIDRPVNTVYYSITEIKINTDAIQKHLIAKGDRKY
jgi:hypothetical protein